MGFFDSLRRILPPSSCSFHDMWKEMSAVNEQLLINTARVHDLQRQLDEVNNQAKARHAEVSSLLWCMYRREGESFECARKRLFEQMPVASGAMRLLQKANAQLLFEFDEFCKSHGIWYFLTAGTLLGAVRHKGSIPWDDDIDVGIMADDLPRILDAAASDSRYRITIVFDNNVSCKQIRFKWSDQDLPCFVDLFLYDYVKGGSQGCIEAYDEMRDSIGVQAQAIQARYGCGSMVHEGEQCAQAYHEMFSQVREKAQSSGLICDRQDAQYLMWSAENMGLTTEEGPIIPIEWFASLVDLEFEGHEYPVPCEFELYLRFTYGDWEEMPRSLAENITHVNVSRLKDSEYQKLESVLS